MNLNTDEKLASIHSKIRTIHQRLDTASLVVENKTKMNGFKQIKDVDDNLEIATTTTTSSKQCCGVERLIQRLKSKLSLLKFAIQRQNFYAHCVKLLILFIIAIVHLIYMHPFLDLMSVLEDYAIKIETKFATEQHLANGHETQLMKQQVDVLADYKKNVWMTLAAMCVALSSSCFFLFILPATKRVQNFHIILVGFMDFIAFATLPAMLLARIELVNVLNYNLPETLRLAHRIVSAQRLMNEAQCTIHPREKLPFCSDLILKSIFPVVLLKFLFILCVMTLAYLFLAWLIEYCIRHWPHYNCQQQQQQQNVNNDFCCTRCCNYHSVLPKKIHYNFCYCQTAWNLPPQKQQQKQQREFNQKTYLPAFLIPPTGFNKTETVEYNKDNILTDNTASNNYVFQQKMPKQLLLTNPLINTIENKIVTEQVVEKNEMISVTIDEPIPAEPKPPTTYYSN